MNLQGKKEKLHMELEALSYPCTIRPRGLLSVLWNLGYHVHLLLGSRGGPLTEDKEQLSERQEVSSRVGTPLQGTPRQGSKT
jgi:hypothetical protein